MSVHAGHTETSTRAEAADERQEQRMGKGGDNREQRAHIPQAAREGTSAGDAGLSTGAHRQLDHGDTEQAKEQMHREKGKT
jgi:hypothetical protein